MSEETCTGGGKRPTSSGKALRKGGGVSGAVEIGPYCRCFQFPNPHKAHGPETSLQIAAIYRRMNQPKSRPSFPASGCGQ